MAAYVLAIDTRINPELHHPVGRHSDVWGSGVEAWGRCWDARAVWEMETGELPELDLDPAFPVPDGPLDASEL